MDKRVCNKGPTIISIVNSIVERSW